MPSLAAPPDDPEAVISCQKALQERREMLFELAGDLNLSPVLCARCGRAVAFHAIQAGGDGVPFRLCGPCGYKQKYT
jgi:ribosomal protein S27AE